MLIVFVWKKRFEFMSGKNVYKKINLKKIFICLFLMCFISFAALAKEASTGAVPKFNPKDPNPKPGLYSLPDMNYEYGGIGIGGSLIGNSKIIIYNCNYPTSRYVDVFDLKTFKFSKLPQLDSHISEMGYSIMAIINDNDELYVLVTKLFEDKGMYLFKYNFKTKENKDLNFFLDKECYSLYKKGDNINLFCTEEINKKYVNTMYKYDLKTNKISDAYYSDTVEYKTIKEKEEKNKIKYRNTPFVDTRRYKNIDDENNFKKKILVNRDEVDYGITVESVLKEKTLYRSWFSPLYIYDSETKKLKPLNEYIRSLYPGYIKIPNKNMVLIVGGDTSIYPKFHNADPKDVPLVKRINGPTVASKRAYIYVYNNL